MKLIAVERVESKNKSKQFPCQLLIVGSDYPFLPKDKQEIIEFKLGKAAAVVGQGHLPWMEDPVGVAQAIIAALSNCKLLAFKIYVIYFEAKQICNGSNLGLDNRSRP